MTKQQENRAFVKMLKEFPKAFGRVSFRERLMLRAAFDYVNEEVIADIKANCDLAIEGRDIKIKELEQKLEQTENDLADYQFNYPTIKELTEGTCFAHLKSLERENTKLKKRVDNLYNSDCWASDQLTKAKELLAKWVELYKPKLEGYPITPIQEHTEQFLKENE